MWNTRESWIVFGPSSQVQIVTYAASIRLACLGIGDPEHPDLTLVEVTRIESIAVELHRRSRLASPPDPHTLAPLAGVLLTRLSPDDDMGASTGPTRARYVGCENPREDGLAAAFALAGSLVLQRDLPWSAIYRWRLAAELLVPAWAIDVTGVDRLAASHPCAPAWLVEQRATQAMHAAAK